MRVRTQGVKSNRDGLGARVVAYAGGLAMERWVQTGASYLTSPEKTVTFGLGLNQGADSLRIMWPSGTVDVFTDIEKNQEILVTEGTGAYERVTLENNSL